MSALLRLIAGGLLCIIFATHAIASLSQGSKIPSEIHNRIAILQLLFIENQG